MEFKDILKDLREDKGLTQAQLADAIRFSLSIVNKWENGKKLPNYNALRILADFFVVPMDVLFDR